MSIIINMENTNNIPTWNLDSLFSSIDSQSYKTYLNLCNESLDNLNALLESADDFTRNNNENFDFAAWLECFLKELEKCTGYVKSICAYAYIVYSTDTTNAENVNNLTSVEDLSIKLNMHQQKFSIILTAHQKYLEEFYARFPQYKECDYILRSLIEETKHQMSPAEEKLAQQMQKTGGDAWSRLQEQIISNLHDENGKTFNEIRNEAHSADSSVRKHAYDTELNLLKSNEIALAASLNNLKGATISLNKKRHWNDALDRAVFSCRLSRKSLDALISSLEDALPMWRKYFQAKAAILRKIGRTQSKTSGSAGHEGLAFYDLFAPLSNPEDKTSEMSVLNRKWTFDEAKDYIIKEYSSFSESMGTFAKEAFEKGWIDAKIRAGKVGGAYDEDFPKGHESRILSNFNGAFDDIITLAHELGHAYHFSCMKGKSPLFFNYPMTLAESASTFAETIVKQDMLKTSSGFDRIRFIEIDLQDASQVLVDILCRFYFERSVFEQRQNSELNAADFCRLMADAQEKSYGCGLNEERHPYMWAVKCHYYITDLDFYNYPYAFGQLFAAGLYARYKKEGAGFAKTYAEILSNTGSMSCEDLCKKAGFDITTKEFWKNGIEMYAKEIEEFAAYADSL